MLNKYKQYIFYIVIILFLIINFVKYKKNNFEKFADKNLKVAVLIISSTNTENKRWKMEKEIWKKYMNKNRAIDCYFIECDNFNNVDIKNNLIKSKCKDSLIPGIYHKTLLSLKQIQDKYDFYIRTNLSTFINLDNLIYQIEKIKKEEYIYTGKIGYITENNLNLKYASGMSMVLNNNIVNLLLKYGFHKKYYDSKLHDDLVIGQVLKDEFRDVINSFGIEWRYDLTDRSITETIFNEIDKKKIPFVRCINKDINMGKKNLELLVSRYHPK